VPSLAWRPELLTLAFALGATVGSFLNVVIERLPRRESLVRPGSRCPGCGHAVKPWDNVPVLSWLWLRGRCRACRARISPRYPAIELLTGLLFAAVVLRYGVVPMTLVWWLFAAALVAAAAIDFEHREIPDEISLGGLALGLLGAPLARTLAGRPFGAALLDSLAGALLGGGLFWLVGFAHARLSRALGRTFEHWPGEGKVAPTPGQLDYWIWFPGVGFGDVKLLAMIGAVQGVAGVLETLIAASLAGLVLGLAWAVATRRWRAPFGFAPALAVGALAVALVPHEPWLLLLGH
jgi:leader peptidase (prepilin peptidase)/N-methyltransferase